MKKKRAYKYKEANMTHTLEEKQSIETEEINVLDLLDKLNQKLGM